MKLLAAVIAGLHVLVEMSITIFGAAQWPLNYVFHPVSFQSWVSFVDFVYTELVPMEANAAARLPAAVLERHADTIGGTEYKVFYVFYGTEYSVCFTIKYTLNELARLLLKLLLALRTFHGTACKALFVSILFIKTLVH